MHEIGIVDYVVAAEALRNAVFDYLTHEDPEGYERMEVCWTNFRNISMKNSSPVIIGAKKRA